jgi:hypothetical protein
MIKEFEMAHGDGVLAASRLAQRKMQHNPAYQSNRTRQRVAVRQQRTPVPPGTGSPSLSD